MLCVSTKRSRLVVFFLFLYCGITPRLWYPRSSKIVVTNRLHTFIVHILVIWLNY